MPSDWVTLAVAGAGIVGTIVSPIVSSWLTGKRDRERNQQEIAKLDKAHGHALEQHRARLVSERRAEIIGKVYAHLVAAETRMADLVRLAESAADRSRREDRAKSAAEAANAFQEYFFAHRIYLDPDTAERLENVRKHLVSVWVDYGTGQQSPELWVKAWKEHREEFPKLRNQLEAQFREALGVVPPRAPAV